MKLTITDVLLFVIIFCYVAACIILMGIEGTVIVVGLALVGILFGADVNSKFNEYEKKIEELEERINNIPHLPTYTEEEMKVFNTAVQVINNNREAQGRYLK